MKTKLIPLIGDPLENLYQLGKKEQASFKRLDDRVTRLLSANGFLRYGQDILSRARALLKKKEETFFEECVAAYAEGLGISASDYMSFISLFELAAHYGQIYPELKGLLPGCTSLFEKGPKGFTHSRLLDFPLIGIFDAAPRLYYWKMEGRPAILNYSCEGMAPLFFQAIHESGMSLALHHKPGHSYHKNGSSIFKLTFEGLFEASGLNEFKRELKKKTSVTKWGYYILDQAGNVLCADIDGPACNFESYHLNESSPLIFTNIPLQGDREGHESFHAFCEQRQEWLRSKWSKKKSQHPLDAMTDVEDQRMRNWRHPASTLSTIGAIHVDLGSGQLHVKEGDGAFVASDPIFAFALDQESSGEVLKKSATLTDCERAWKRASLAQMHFDQGEWDMAYHELQMAQSLMPLSHWKEIMGFYLNLWDFKFITNKRELAQVYCQVKKLKVPPGLLDQWLFLCMRMEKKLSLQPTVNESDLSLHLRKAFSDENAASMPVFTAWMKLLYPRIEILDVFSPHHK